jgi:hypothetical protein
MLVLDTTITTVVGSVVIPIFVSVVTDAKVEASLLLETDVLGDGLCAPVCPPTVTVD